MHTVSEESPVHRVTGDGAFAWGEGEEPRQQQQGPLPHRKHPGRQLPHAAPRRPSRRTPVPVPRREGVPERSFLKRRNSTPGGPRRPKDRLRKVCNSDPRTVQFHPPLTPASGRTKFLHTYQIRERPEAAVPVFLLLNSFAEPKRRQNDAIPGNDVHTPLRWHDPTHMVVGSGAARGDGSPCLGPVLS